MTALPRRRIEIYRDAGETWRFAESLKSVSEDTAQEYEGRTILEPVQNGHDALGTEAPGRIAVLAVGQAGGGVLYVANEGLGFTGANFRAITELALSTRRLLTDEEAVARLVRLGLRKWDDQQHAGAGVKQLVDALDAGDVPAYLSVSFRRQHERAWAHLARSGRWPWAPGEEVRLVASRANTLGTLAPAADGTPVHICDEADPLKEALIDLAGPPCSSPRPSPARPSSAWPRRTACR
ncbi:hypothetical protein ACWCXX_37400 [Streptomyces sp. NPDC001732]